MLRRAQPTPLPAWRKGIHALCRDDAWAMIPLAIVILGACFA